MLNFLLHSHFEKETAAMKRRFPAFDEALESFKMLANVQFATENPRQVIAPGKIHRVCVIGICTLWKVELAIKGVKSNQSPRIWFAIQGASLAFLCAKSHIDNYDNNSVDRLAQNLVTDIF